MLTFAQELRTLTDAVATYHPETSKNSASTRIFDANRERIIEFMTGKAPQTIVEIMAGTGFTETGVGEHLRRMVRDGLAEREGKRGLKVLFALTRRAA